MSTYYTRLSTRPAYTTPNKAPPFEGAGGPYPLGISTCKCTSYWSKTKSHPSSADSTNLSSLKLFVDVVVVSMGCVADRNRMADDPKWLIEFDDEFDEGNEDNVVDDDGSTETWVPRKLPAIEVVT